MKISLCLLGLLCLSSFAKDIETITFNNLEYKVITSPITGKKWLDRNLGALQACTSSTDKACYGDYYQWGRLADGHEKLTSKFTETIAPNLLNAGNSFIRGYDWININENRKLRTEQWKKIDGSGICPAGFRVPTKMELENETTNYNGKDTSSTQGKVKVIDANTVFKSFLKFPSAGGRDNFTGDMYGIGKWGSVWVISDNNDYLQYFLSFEKEKAYFDGDNRGYGYSVRCVEGK